MGTRRYRNLNPAVPVCISHVYTLRACSVWCLWRHSARRNWNSPHLKCHGVTNAEKNAHRTHLCAKLCTNVNRFFFGHAWKKTVTKVIICEPSRDHYKIVSSSWQALNIFMCKSARVPLLSSTSFLPTSLHLGGPIQTCYIATPGSQPHISPYHPCPRLSPCDTCRPNGPQAVLSETSSKVPLSHARHSRPPTLRSTATALNPFEVHVRLLELWWPGCASYSTNAWTYCVLVSHTRTNVVDCQLAKLKGGSVWTVE